MFTSIGQLVPYMRIQCFPRTTRSMARQCDAPVGCQFPFRPPERGHHFLNYEPLEAIQRRLWREHNRPVPQHADADHLRVATGHLIPQGVDIPDVFYQSVPMHQPVVGESGPPQRVDMVVPDGFGSAVCCRAAVMHHEISNQVEVALGIVAIKLCPPVNEGRFYTKGSSASVLATPT